MTPLSPEQRRALDTPGPEVAVAAGAGSGKTTLLAEAVWEDLEEGGVRPEELVVATYNRAAAEHLAARLQARFADPRRGRGPERAGLDLSEAWVGTFHAICARLVRERPFAAGVDPGFTELDETAAAAVVEAALDEAVEATDHPGLDDLLARSWGPAPVRDAVRAVHERLRAAGHERPRLTVPAATGSAPAAAVRVRRAVAALIALPGVREDHLQAAELALAMADTGELPPKLPRASRNCAHNLRPAVEDLNAAAKGLFDALAEALAVPQLEGFGALLAAFGDAYARRKREIGALDYEDLQLAARRVLRAGPPHRVRSAYVDEFQDANALQDEILGLLRAERTVVVGDGCQAIYGFRHADAGRFLRRLGGSAAELRDNHRSQAPLLGALNAWLGGALAGEAAFRPLHPAAAPEPGPDLADPPAELVTAVAPDGGRTDRVHEARAVADAVVALLARGYRPRDVAVLFRALTAVEPYQEALEAAGVPTHLVAGRGFFAHEQVADTLAMLRVVENPWDEEALVRVLASPYAAASDDDLVRLREAAGERGPLWPAVGAVPALAPAATAIRRLRALRREAGLAGLVDAAATARGYDLAALGMVQGARRAANLRRLVRMAESFAAVRGPDLRGFLDLVALRAEAEDPGEAVLVDPGLEAVRLATVHGVKGQEFPAVVLADASHRPAAAGPVVLADPDGRCGIRLQRHGEDASVPALGYEELDRAAREAGAAEERRILYVALTRARRHVTVVGRAERGGGGETAAYALLKGALAGLDGAVAHRTVEVPDPVGPDPARRPELPLARVADPPPAPEIPRSDPVAGRSLSFTALAMARTCRLRHHLEVELGLRGGGPGEPPPGAGDGPWGGAAFGALVHDALGTHRWGDPAPSPGWAAPAAAAAGLPPSTLEAARAEAMVRVAVGGSVGARLAAAGAVSERRFALPLGGALMTGAIDALALDGASALVVDWKTHRLGVRAVEAEMPAYRLQQALYGLVALRAGAERAELLWVFLEDPEREQRREVAAADRAALEAEVVAALDELRDPDRSPAAREPQSFCSGCPGLRAFCPVSRALSSSAADPGGAPPGVGGP